MTLRWISVLVLALGLTACDGGESDGDGGGAPGEDGGPPGMDAAPPDVDGGPRPDGAPPPRVDAGPPDPACSLPPAFDEGASYTTELYVATDGSDGADGSSGAPLATIRAAADRATPGTRITVRAGTYGAVGLGTVSGTESAPIAFVADGDVTIDASSGVGWAMSDAAYVVIEGFTIADASIHGMNLDDGGDYSTPSHHLILRVV